MGQTWVRAEPHAQGCRQVREATVGDVVWAVREGSSLLGLFAVRADAERRASQVRPRRGSQTADDSRRWSVRVEPWTVSPPSGQQPWDWRAGEQHRARLDYVHREWGLLNIPAMGTGHYLHLDTYLVVPYRNRLTCPAFQFDHERKLWTGFREALGTFRDVGWDEFSITVWFTSPQGAADGAVPADLIRSEPERVLDAVKVTVAG